MRWIVIAAVNVTAILAGGCLPNLPFLMGFRRSR